MFIVFIGVDFIRVALTGVMLPRVCFPEVALAPAGQENVALVCLVLLHWQCGARQVLSLSAHVGVS